MFLGGGVAAGAAFFDNALGVGVGLAEDFLAAEFGVGELLLDLLGVGLAFFDGFAALFENGDDRSEGEFLQDDVNGEEKDDLSEEFRPGDAELTKKLDDCVHENRMMFAAESRGTGTGGLAARSRRLIFSVLRKRG